MATEITAEIAQQIDTITKIYVAAYRSNFDLVARWRTANPGRSPRNAYGMTGAARLADRVTRYVDGMPGTGYLDEGLLAKASRRDAEALVACYAAKVEMKAKGMTDVTVTRMDAAGGFVVTGRKAGQDVEIRQSIVTKTSPKGNFFHQFPALVYIAGRKSTEKALHSLAA